MARKRLYGEKERTEIKRLRSLGLTWAQVQRATGINATTAKTLVDSEYAEQRRNRVNQLRGPNRSNHRVDSITAEEFQKIRQRQLAVPKDTRSITGVLLGDPLPGRSALDRRAAQ